MANTQGAFSKAKLAICGPSYLCGFLVGVAVKAATKPVAPIAEEPKLQMWAAGPIGGTGIAAYLACKAGFISTATWSGLGASLALPWVATALVGDLVSKRPMSVWRQGFHYARYG